MGRRAASLRAPLGRARAALALGVALACATALLAAQLASAAAAASPVTLTAGSSEVRHFEYVFDDGTFYVYDMDNSQQLVQTVSLPQTESGLRGVTVAPASHLLFISYGGDGAGYTGSVLAYNLVTEQVVWTVHLSTGIDSGQVSPDGTRLYMPTGELTPSGIWNVLSTTNGEVIETIKGGAGAHNTIASNDGHYVYLGGREYNYLDVYETATKKVVREIGPLVNTVRPFTVNGSNTLAFTTATEFDGFQVSSITTGKVLFTVSFGPVPAGFPFSAPSHGVSLSPDEKQLYVIDSPNKEVRVYDVSRVAEGVAPSEIGAIPVAGLSGTETPCAYDCTRGGWLQHSLDGRFVYVGDSGEVIETKTRHVVTTLAPLLNTKKTLEVDWADGVPVATSGRSGVGYVTSPGEPPAEEPPAEEPPAKEPPAEEPPAKEPPAKEPPVKEPPTGPSPKGEPTPPGSSQGGSSSLSPTSTGGAPLISPPVTAPASSVAAFQAAPSPSIRHLTVSPRVFSALASAPTGGRGLHRVAAIVRYEDTLAATTTLSVFERGSASARRACPQGAPAASGRRCGAVEIARFVHRDRAGVNRIALSGRLGSRKLTPGSYRLVATPSADGRTGARSAVTFDVVA